MKTSGELRCNINTSVYPLSKKNNFQLKYSLQGSKGDLEYLFQFQRLALLSVENIIKTLYDKDYSIPQIRVFENENFNLASLSGLGQIDILFDDSSKCLIDFQKKEFIFTPRESMDPLSFSFESIKNTEQIFERYSFLLAGTIFTITQYMDESLENILQQLSFDANDFLRINSNDRPDNTYVVQSQVASFSLKTTKGRFPVSGLQLDLFNASTVPGFPSTPSTFLNFLLGKEGYTDGTSLPFTKRISCLSLLTKQLFPLFSKIASCIMDSGRVEKASFSNNFFFVEFLMETDEEIL